MADSSARRPALTVHRAFVVHLSTGRGPGRRRFSGRVEHLASGESAHFMSLRELLAFFDRPWPASPGPSGRPDGWRATGH